MSGLVSVRSVVLGGLVLGLTLGCSAPAKKGPVTTLDRYGSALRGGDFADAYALMSESFRARYSKQEFVRMLKENKREVDDTAARLEAGPSDFNISAEFRYGLGDRMRLVLERGAWRIDSNPVQFYSMATPRDAMRSFVRAYRLERWDVMLRFVPGKYAEEMNEAKMKDQFRGEDREQVASMMNMLEANLDEPIDDKGNEARMPYGDRYEVKFIREDGLWKIQDLD